MTGLFTFSYSQDILFVPVNFGVLKYLAGKVAMFNDVSCGFFALKEPVISSGLKKKTSMAPFSSDNDGPGRRHSGENFIRPLYIVEVSPPRTYYVTLRARQKKNISASLGKLTRPLFRGESFRENGEKLTSCIRSKAVVVAHSIFVERICSVSR